MRREAKRPATTRAKPNGSQAKQSKLTQALVTRIRERREEIRQRVGVLSDTAILIRDDRDR
jgi:hypothetical protein